MRPDDIALFQIQDVIGRPLVLHGGVGSSVERPLLPCGVNDDQIGASLVHRAHRSFDRRSGRRRFGSDVAGDHATEELDALARMAFPGRPIRRPARYPLFDFPEPSVPLKT